MVVRYNRVGKVHAARLRVANPIFSVLRPTHVVWLLLLLLLLLPGRVIHLPGILDAVTQHEHKPRPQCLHIPLHRRRHVAHEHATQLDKVDTCRVVARAPQCCT
jgi:hypothetical protein